MARSAIFNNVDPRLANLIQQVAGGYGPYGVRVVSGYRPNTGRKQGKYHPLGEALDVELYDRRTGKALGNYHDSPENFAAYQQFANAVYQAADPETKQLLRWGGYFSGGPQTYGALDLMHFDLGGAGNTAGGSWEAGLSPQQAKIYGIQAGGGIGGGAGGGGALANSAQYGPPMPASRMDFTPEQRRAAIASIESAGSGDYGALGAWTGDPVEGRDRAYGRYQIMGKNIPAWSKQVLGRSLTPQEFMADPKAQDAIFDKIFGEYVRKYGESGAASMWFTGSPDSPPDRNDALGTTVKSYKTRYLEALGAPLQKGEDYPAQTSGPGVPDAPAPPGSGAPVPGAPGGALSGKGGLSGMMEGLGQAFGAGGAAAKMAPMRGTPPVATMVPTSPGQMLDPQALQEARARLAMAMQRLNSGKLWT